MSIERLDKRIDKMESENAEAHKELVNLIMPIRERLFNGMSDSLKKIELAIPNLMTKELHHALETSRAEANRVLGQKKDRWLKAGLGIVPIVTGAVLFLLERLL